MESKFIMSRYQISLCSHFDCIESIFYQTLFFCICNYSDFHIFICKNASFAVLQLYDHERDQSIHAGLFGRQWDKHNKSINNTSKRINPNEYTSSHEKMHDEQKSIDLNNEEMRIKIMLDEQLLLHLSKHLIKESKSEFDDNKKWLDKHTKNKTITRSVPDPNDDAKTIDKEYTYQEQMDAILRNNDANGFINIC